MMLRYSIGLLVILASCAAPLKAPVYPRLVLSVRSNPVVGVIGDTQRTGIIEVWRERNDLQREGLMGQLNSAHPDALLILGDMVFYGSSSADWEYFDDLMKPIRRSGIPVYPLLGNHEYFGDDDDMLHSVRERFPTFDSTWYSLVIDSVAYVMLNTNYRDIGMKEMGRQHSWYMRTMHRYENADSVMFIVVCGHHPPYTNSTVVDDEDILQSYFVPAYMLSKKGAVWFTGHCHAYEHFYKGLKHFVVSGGGGGPRQRVLTGMYQQHIDMYEGGMVRPFHYCLVQRREKTLYVKMVPLLTKAHTPADSFAVASKY